MIPQKSKDTIPDLVSVKQAAIWGVRTGQVEAVGEKVRGVRNQEDQAALNLGVPPQVGEFEKQGCGDANDDTDE